MKLANATLSPGVVINSDDPEKLGRVQCIIAGMSSPHTMNTEQLPWCAPLSIYGFQRMSKPKDGQKIWVLHDSENYYEFYYIPAWEVNQNTSILPEEEDYDVLVSRPGEGFGAQLFYTREQGFVQRIGNEVSSTMTGENTIVHTDKNVEMAIRDGHVYHGRIEGRFEKAVLGETLYELLSNLSSKLNEAALAAKDNCYTTTLYPPLAAASLAISETLEYINSEHVFVSE